MTMPHLMNCDHSSDGWCLACVKQMHDERERMRSVLEIIENNYEYSTQGYRNCPMHKSIKAALGRTECPDCADCRGWYSPDNGQWVVCHCVETRKHKQGQANA